MTATVIQNTIQIPDFVGSTTNLCSPRLGTVALRCSDDSFASRERMLEEADPVFKPDVYDDFGKWMDGWESKRRRYGGHDWCVIRLGVPGDLVGLELDTTHFTGNFPPAASVWGSKEEDDPGDASESWEEILESVSLGPSKRHFFDCKQPGPWRWLRLNIYPDGGIARFRAYGNVLPDWSFAGSEIELSGLKNGGRIVAYNDAHYGNVKAVLDSGRGINMGDGWETRRRREPGFDWLLIALGAVGEAHRIEVDTSFYIGNSPAKCSVQAQNVEWGTDQSLITQSMFWPELLTPKDLTPDTIHTFELKDLEKIGPVSHVKLNIFPDGGISRFRVFGSKL